MAQGHLWRRWGRVTAAAAAMGALAWAVAQSQVTSIIGSFLELGGQVIAPSNSATLNSTSDVSPNDVVRWTSYFSSRIDSPFEAEGQFTLPNNHTWVAGSVKKPSNTTLQWQVNNAWTTTEPGDGALVTGVKWLMSYKFLGATSTVSKAVNFSGTGDGYRIIPYKDGLYVVNHHNTGNVLKCRSAADGQTCPGWSANGYPFELNSGTSLTSGSNYYYGTPNNPMEALNYSTGELFVGVSSSRSDAQGTYIVCTNLDTLKSCGSWPVGSGTNYTYLTNYNSIGDKYYVSNSSGELICFDIAKRQLCGRTSYPGSFSTYGTSTALGTKLYFSPYSAQMYCHDAATNATCAGWTASGVNAGGGAGAYPYLANDGSPMGVCTNTGNCVSAGGSVFTASSAYASFIGTYQLYYSAYHNLGAIQGSKIYSSSGNTVACFDFATHTRCGSWISSGPLSAYTTRFDPTRPNCLMLLGDPAYAMIFDPSTGGECKNGIPAKLPDFTFNPIGDYFQCDTSRANVRKWGKLRLSPSLPWGGASGLDRVTATLKDANGAALPAALKPVRDFPLNTYQLDVSDIPYSQYPTLKVGLELHSPSLLPSTAVFGIDLTYDGDPLQVCVAAKAPAVPDCQTGASLTVSSRAVDYTQGTFQETQTASKVMSQGGLTNGYAAYAAATTPRLTLTSQGPLTPKTQVVQGRWSLPYFSGDLWAFNFNTSGQLIGDPHVSAQAVTLAPTSRPMFTAPPADTGSTRPVVALNWASLTLDQQAALNLNMNGVTDNQGPARVAYLRGTDGSFRGRNGTSLGPVFSSAPAVLPVAPMAGLPEAQFPGYGDYRRTATRTYPLALFGANDGALHAYEAQGISLREAWSFVPDVMLRKASRYSDPTIAGIRGNPYFIDNVPMVGHVKSSNHGWRALAVITYGRGARAITALDVTTTTLSAGKGVLFEYSNTSHADLKDLGYIISQPLHSPVMSSPQLVPLGTGGQQRWAVLVGNGINSNDGSGGAAASGTGKPVLYAFYVDPNSGPKWHRWAVDELWSGAAAEPELSRNNGLSTPTPVDIDGNGSIDLVYAGDMQGNLWRFDVRNPAAVGVTRLFKTQANQPISQAPYVVMNPAAKGCGSGNSGGASRCWQVVFSTGAPLSPLLGSSNVATQSIYSVLDKGQGTSVALGALTTIPFETNQVLSGVEYRALKPTLMDYSAGALGWRIDLQSYEHGVGAPKALPSGLLLLMSVRPAAPDRGINVCAGMRSWLNEVDPINGSTRTVAFDTNGDGNMDAKDMINPTSSTPLAPQGMAISGAQFGPPTMLLASANASQQLSLLVPSLGQDNSQTNSWYGSGSGTSTNPSAPGGNSSALTHANKSRLGRMSWREVY